jgi:hypothetical protein
MQISSFNVKAECDRPAVKPVTWQAGNNCANQIEREENHLAITRFCDLDKPIQPYV